MPPNCTIHHTYLRINDALRDPCLHFVKEIRAFDVGVAHANTEKPDDIIDRLQADIDSGTLKPKTRKLHEQLIAYIEKSKDLDYLITLNAALTGLDEDEVERRMDEAALKPGKKTNSIQRKAVPHIVSGVDTCV